MRNRVREVRREQRLSQGELAERVGVARQTINAIENARSVPTLELALKLCSAFGMPVEQMFRLDDREITSASGKSRTDGE